jgi:hypothetical protein
MKTAIGQAFLGAALASVLGLLAVPASAAGLIGDYCTARYETCLRAEVGKVGCGRLLQQCRLITPPNTIGVSYPPIAVQCGSRKAPLSQHRLCRTAATAR